VAGPAAQVRDRGANRRLRQDAQAKCQRRRRDVVPLLKSYFRGDGRQLVLGELPVRRAAPGGPVPQYRKQP